MKGWQRIAQFTWDRQDVMRACEGNKAATEVLEYLLYCFRLRAKDHRVDDLADPVYTFTYTAEHLASKTHFSVVTVRRGIRLLKGKGLLFARQSNGHDRTTSYQINFSRIEAWFKEKMPLFPPNHPEHAETDLPCGQIDHMEVITLTTSKVSSRPLATGQDDHLIIIPNAPQRSEEEEMPRSSSSQIKLMEENTGLSPEICSLCIPRKQPDDLFNAALECWGERIDTIRDKSKERPVRFFRGIWGNPGAFGIKSGANGWYYPRAKVRDGKETAIVAEAKKRIMARRANGQTDQQAYSEMSREFTGHDSLLKQAFQELINA